MGMVEEVIPIVTQFGAAGLIGVLWIVERRHALLRDRQLDEAHKSITQVQAVAESLLTVVKENTRAITALEGSQRQLVRLLERLAPTPEPQPSGGASGKARPDATRP